VTLNPIFFDQVRLLVSSLPQIVKEECFALKGGTAINLFVRDMPRLSVDIDLAYLPLEDRDTSLNKIDAALKRISNNISRYLPGTRLSENSDRNSGYCNRIQVQSDRALIKIEVTPVLRGCIHQPVICKLSPAVEQQFGAAEMLLLHFNDLYGGKICAALDRQHPRDLFDVHYLLMNEGLSEDLKDCFLVYLISHNRPMAELLNPSRKDIGESYENEFVGMTREAIPVAKLYQAREMLIADIHKLLNENDRDFLLSFKSGNPNWQLFRFPEAEKLPAVQWKLLNISRIEKKKMKESLRKLEQILSSGQPISH